MDVDTSFGRWRRTRRRALDLTQANLARQVGCAVITIQKLEADERRPSRLLAERLAASPNLIRPAKQVLRCVDALEPMLQVVESLLYYSIVSSCKGKGTYHLQLSCSIASLSIDCCLPGHYFDDRNVAIGN